ncbi:hypothetical protein A2697_02385 [Candidatus Curtissbacteria bacterium RIFCSPHIGHO2_01_FULL_41_44]|uniref:DUF304 domain-containing protein n=1 Tax=Candidatus Curtissbacteria bacterium RIFCSPLOWO2_01_FULL_42_50 TaxID=1797730 RepID=A0A1F5H5I4_9BACT|nr:MAG: hypothetical protein A2697_02385 [Candidatus Curtissbacteria bacterium RIFCSPHIGHO2_01_FULL_41_44]OGD94430.1 MAG: hypothetical protein A3C33_04030 [Candidatus Curtissbacteria bacterium RIFCSPHIGHO2_02_FULL_42_58]OGD97602.1 MAG: hypothetical protein A3E71_05275 [Candidatus Curtissbacteria bacterium RIFCSPHIGHO2_12_FULL_42_33]OGD99304.1 MAG: hypothetical protein A3B54_02885 [Candidatus Curtissbacteria bacterium RIFCSPLOWO2_01_FULL_42_50]OGE02574.1 MAG: hypothetical protein A3G16_03530 [Ca
MATHNPFAMFAPQPVGVRFENQEEGEKIILLLRAHIVTLIPAVLTTIFLVVGPIFVPRLLTLANIDLTDLLRGGRLFLITLFWYLVTFGYAFYKFVFWYFNVYLLTNERIIDFDFRGVLHKEISYATLLHIEDVEPKTVGFFGTFFNYGDVFVQTAGTRPKFEFEKVPRPDAVAEAILDEARKEEAEAPGEIA